MTTITTTYQPKLSLLPLRETPAYRVTANAASCNQAELLAAVIGGTQQIEIADALLARFDGNLQRIYRAPTEQIATVRGLGKNTAVKIKAALALGLRLSEPSLKRRPVINSPESAAALVQYEMSLYEQEYLKVIVLSTRNHVLAIEEIAHGSANSAHMRVAEILRPAMERNAPSIILVHNHPSGDPDPSQEDIAFTRKVLEAGKLLDIEVLDHLVIGKNSFVSLKSRNLLVSRGM